MIRIKKILSIVFVFILLFCVVGFTFFFIKHFYLDEASISVLEKQIDPEYERLNFLKNSTELEIKNNSKKIPVLLYHHISDDIINEMMVSQKTFEAHMKALYENGYYTLTIDDIISYIEDGKEIPEKSVLITFDDGYYSNYEYAFPILKKYKLKATIFVIGVFFGKNKYKGTNNDIVPYFGFKEKEEMEKSGIIEIACHTYDLHQTDWYEKAIGNLNLYEDILKTEDETNKEYKKRLNNDCDMWENLFDKQIISYSYPHGLVSAEALQILKKRGVKVTFNTEAKTDIIIKNNQNSAYNLGRYTITEDFKASDVLELIK